VAFLHFKCCQPCTATTASHAGVWRLAVVQRGHPAECARPLEADFHHPEPVLGTQGLPGVRPRWSDEAFAVLRPRGRCYGGAGEITVQLRDRQEFLVDRYSERKENAEQLFARVNSDRPEAMPRMSAMGPGCVKTSRPM